MSSDIEGPRSCLPQNHAWVNIIHKLFPRNFEIGRRAAILKADLSFNQISQKVVKECRSVFPRSTKWRPQPEDTQFTVTEEPENIHN